MAQWIKIQLANAGHIGSKPGPRIPSAVDKLSPCTQSLSPRAATTEACVPRARAPQQERPLQRAACTPQQKAAPIHCNERKPKQSNKDSTQSKIIFFKNRQQKSGIRELTLITAILKAKDFI